MTETSVASVIVPDPSNERATSVWPRISWGLFLLILIMTLLVAFGAPTSAGFIIAGIVAVLFAWRFPYFSFYLTLATAPLIGIIVSISTGKLQFGERAFGGSIDVTIGELVASAVLAAWGLRILLLWRGRRDHNWKPWLPLLVPYALLVGAHLLSGFSAMQPDRLLVLKYSLRPVLLVYLTSVVLPVNFIRSRRRLIAALGVMTAVGVFFALDGFRSLFFGNPGAFLTSAHPLPILGVSPIGENHNVLAELLVLTAPLALAFAVLARSVRWRSTAVIVSAFMGIMALLTFARSAWIALGVEVIFLSVTVWRDWIKKHVATLLVIFLMLLPIAGYMVIFSTSFGARSSISTRTMLTGIAWDLFTTSPIIGVGAGTFVDHVASTYIFTYEFGDALDSHGILQKLAAETGLVGLAAFAMVLIALGLSLRSTWTHLRAKSDDQLAFSFFIAGVMGSFVYQLFNTTYWTPKLWLAVGLALAAERVFRKREIDRDPNFLTHG